MLATINGDSLGSDMVKHAKCANGVIVPFGDSYRQDTGIISPTLLNGWVNYGGSYILTQFTRKAGMVTITGMVKAGVISTTLPIFNLPVGFRPKGRIVSTQMSNGAACRMDVLANGDVLPYSGSNAWYSFNLTFKAEQ